MLELEKGGHSVQFKSCTLVQKFVATRLRVDLVIQESISYGGRGSKYERTKLDKVAVSDALPLEALRSAGFNHKSRSRRPLGLIDITRARFQQNRSMRS